MGKVKFKKLSFHKSLLSYIENIYVEKISDTLFELEEINCLDSYKFCPKTHKLWFTMVHE